MLLRSKKQCKNDHVSKLGISCYQTGGKGHLHSSCCCFYSVLATWAIRDLQLRFQRQVARLGSKQQWSYNGKMTCDPQVMDVEMLAKMTLTKTVCQTLTISALKMWTLVRLISEDFRWFPWIPKEHPKMIQTGLFVIRVKNWFRQSTVILALQLVRGKF